jgi:aminoglycoside phosphotransferase (APT) family kinase protein
VETPQQSINSDLVRRLITDQFPQWSNLPIRSVARGGSDNRTFHLGDDMSVRLPSHQAYAGQIEVEQRWLPVLACALPLPIPQPLAMGEPGHGYAWKWSIYRWIPGEVASPEAIKSLPDFSRQLARFLVSLQKIDSTNGPRPGSQNFYRGGNLSIYDDQVRFSIAALDGRIDVRAADRAWREALSTCWEWSPVWVHGDVAMGNLLLTKGRLSGVIDFGQLAVGDPACDLAIAWTLMRDDSREIFRHLLGLDSATWHRGRAWALWKALILAAGVCKSSAAETLHSWQIIGNVLDDYVHEP